MTASANTFAVDANALYTNLELAKMFEYVGEIRTHLYEQKQAPSDLITHVQKGYVDAGKSLKLMHFACLFHILDESFGFPREQLSAPNAPNNILFSETSFARHLSSNLFDKAFPKDVPEEVQQHFHNSALVFKDYLNLFGHLSLVHMSLLSPLNSHLVLPLLAMGEKYLSPELEQNKAWLGETEYQDVTGPAKTMYQRLFDLEASGSKLQLSMEGHHDTQGKHTDTAAYLGWVEESFQTSHDKLISTVRFGGMLKVLVKLRLSIAEENWQRFYELNKDKKNSETESSSIEYAVTELLADDLRLNELLTQLDTCFGEVKESLLYMPSYNFLGKNYDSADHLNSIQKSLGEIMARTKWE